LAGAEAITAQQDRDFSQAADTGNWAIVIDGGGTGALTYDTTDLGGPDDKQALLTSTGDTYAHAGLSVSASGGGGDAILTANTLYKVSAKVYVPSGNTKQTVGFTWSNIAGETPSSVWVNMSSDLDSFTEISGYFYLAADVVGTFRIGFNGDPTDGDKLYFDDISIQPVQISWAPIGTAPTLEIDETNDALLITADNNARGATLGLGDAYDLSSNLVVGQSYLVSFDAKASSGDTVQVEISNAANDVLAITGDIDDSSFTSYELVFVADSINTNKISGQGMAATDTLSIRNLSIQSIPDLAILEPSDFVNASTVPAKPRYETPGLLIEGESTNLVLQSRNFDTSPWVSSGSTPTANEIGIDGVANTAFTLTDISAAAGAYVTQTISISADTEVYTVSCFVKKDLAATVFPEFWVSGSSGTMRNHIQLDLTNGTTGSRAKDDAGDYSYTEDHGDWWRVVGTITNDNSTSIVFRVYPAVGETTVGSNFENSLTGSIIIDSFQIEKTPYVTSVIPTLASPVTRTSEAADGTYGYGWTMSATLKNILSNALPGGGATPAIGTLIIEWEAAQDYDAVDTGSRGLVSVTGTNVNPFYFTATEGQITVYDGTNFNTLTIDHSRGDDLINVYRWDNTADGGSGYLLTSNKKNTTWDLNAGNESAFDGAFALGTDLLLNYSNELPIHISRIRIYDEYLTDAQLEGLGDVIGSLMELSCGLGMD